jgi:hypothetical protein
MGAVVLGHELLEGVHLEGLGPRLNDGLPVLVHVRYVHVQLAQLGAHLALLGWAAYLNNWVLHLLLHLLDHPGQ